MVYKEQLASLLLFLRTPMEQLRMVFLQRLFLSLIAPPSHLPSDSLRVFFQDLAIYSPLKTLAIRYSEALIVQDPGLVDLISALKTIEDLRVHAAGDQALSLIRLSQSCLVHATVELGTCGTWGISPANADAVDILKHSQHTLESIKLVFPGCLMDIGPVYPRVNSLSVKGIRYTPYISCYVRTFPNLVTLSFSDIHYHEILSNADIDAARATNVDFVRTSSAWSALNSICMPLELLYTYGVSRTVREIIVDDFDCTESDPRLGYMLHTVLNDVHPKILKYHATNCVSFLDPTFVAAFTAKRHSPIETLHLKLELVPDSRENVDVLEVMVSNFLHLSPISRAQQKHCRAWNPGHCMRNRRSPSPQRVCSSAQCTQDP